MARKKSDSNWKEKAREELEQLSKEQLIEKIVKKRAETYSKTGKRNVSTAKSHERRCKSLLTDWSGVEFRRRRVEGRGDDVSVVEGVADVIPVDRDVIFAIEAKKGEKFSIDHLMDKPEAALFTEWWHQVNYDAKILTDKTGIQRYPLLFFKPHPNWDWIAIDSDCFDQSILKPKNGDRSLIGRCWFPHLRFDSYGTLGPVEHNVSTSKKNPVMFALELKNCVICRWKTFAEEVNPTHIFLD